jgi:glycosyltransferase involved in cell wall biosynthesis
MTKVLFLAPSFLVGGAERVLVRLLREIDTGPFDIHLGVLLNEGPLRTEVSSHTTLHDLGCRRARYALTRMVGLIRTLEPDIVFTTLSRLNVLLLGSKCLLPKGTKLVVREANTPSAELGQLPGGTLYPYLYRVLYPRADAIVCQSDYMLRDLVSNFGAPRWKIARIYNPVPFEEIHGAADAPSPLGNGFNFVSAGKMDHQKGFDVLIKAFGEVADELPQATLTLVGKGDIMADLQALTAELGLGGRVVFSGFQANPYPYFKYADVFVSSSRFEGLPNVVLEALACGTPVLATDCPGGTAEIVSVDVNGWLVATESVSAMSRGILLAAREVDRFDRIAVRSSVERFSSERIAREYLQLFDRLLEVQFPSASERRKAGGTDV